MKSLFRSIRRKLLDEGKLVRYLTPTSAAAPLKSDFLSVLEEYE